MYMYLPYLRKFIILNCKEDHEDVRDKKIEKDVLLLFNESRDFLSYSV